MPKRRMAHFGCSCEYETAGLSVAPPIPEFIAPLRRRIGELTTLIHHVIAADDATLNPLLLSQERG